MIILSATKGFTSLFSPFSFLSSNLISAKPIIKYSLFMLSLNFEILKRDKLIFVRKSLRFALRKPEKLSFLLIIILIQFSLEENAHLI